MRCFDSNIGDVREYFVAFVYVLREQYANEHSEQESKATVDEQTQRGLELYSRSYSSIIG